MWVILCRRSLLFDGSPTLPPLRSLTLFIVSRAKTKTNATKTRCLFPIHGEEHTKTKTNKNGRCYPRSKRKHQRTVGNRSPPRRGPPARVLTLGISCNAALYGVLSVHSVVLIGPRIKERYVGASSPPLIYHLIP